jgi:hypothetical protein
MNSTAILKAGVPDQGIARKARSAAATIKVSGYSQKSENTTGATKLFSSPPRIPPAEIHK